MDNTALDHGELSKIDKHVIVGKNRNTIIDFESSSTNRKSSNVTSATQAIFIGTGLAKIIQKKIRLPTRTKIINLIRQYKKNPTLENFEKITIGLKLQTPGKFEKEVHMLYSDKKLEPLIRKIGPCTMRITKNPYQTLVEAIIYQQLSEASATAIANRFLKIYGKFPTTKEVMKTSNKKLKDKVYAGAKIRYGEVGEMIRQRIEYELDLITQKGFAPYFLIVQDIVTQTRATIGRGSAAASIVSYCLFITQVDPLRYTLQFERFIHPEREDMPDIDVDFPWDERDDILDYVFKKYGNERTAMVSSQIFLKPRSAIREVGKVHGLSNEEIKSITKRIGWYASRRDLEHWVRTDSRFANVDLDDTLIRVLRESEKISQ